MENSLQRPRPPCYRSKEEMTQIAQYSIGFAGHRLLKYHMCLDQHLLQFDCCMSSGLSCWSSGGTWSRHFGSQYSRPYPHERNFIKTHLFYVDRDHPLKFYKSQNGSPLKQSWLVVMAGHSLKYINITTTMLDWFITETLEAKSRIENVFYWYWQMKPSAFVVSPTYPIYPITKKRNTRPKKASPQENQYRKERNYICNPNRIFMFIPS